MPGVPRAMTSTSTSSAIFLSRKWTLRMLDALVLGRERHHDLAVEPARAQQGGVEHVGPVGGGHHHDALGRLEAVHLREHLVQRLLALVVPAAETGAALAADGVDLVDEDDRRRLLACGLEEVAHAGRTDADEHLHEVGAGDRHERHPGLTGDGTRDERLAGARRADEQHALGDARADLLELPRVLEEVDDLGDLLLHGAVARDVGERRLRLLGVVHLRPAAPDVHHRAHLALRASAHPHEEADDQHERQRVDDEVAPDAAARVGVLEVDVLLLQQREHRLRQVVLRARARELGVALLGLLERAADRARRLVELDGLDVAVLHLLLELRVGEVGLRGAAAREAADRGTPRRRARARPRAPSAATTTCRRPAGDCRSAVAASGARAGRRCPTGAGGGRVAGRTDHAPRSGASRSRVAVGLPSGRWRGGRRRLGPRRGRAVVVGVAIEVGRPARHGEAPCYGPPPASPASAYGGADARLPVGCARYCAAVRPAPVPRREGSSPGASATSSSPGSSGSSRRSSWVGSSRAGASPRSTSRSPSPCRTSGTSAGSHWSPSARVSARSAPTSASSGCRAAAGGRRCRGSSRASRSRSSATTRCGALQLVHGEDAKQEIVRVVERGSGSAFVLLVVTVLVVAPVAEELMFRGVLLRSLLRRFGPGAAVLVSAVAFGWCTCSTSPSDP